jgi:hypothetical protein
LAAARGGVVEFFGESFEGVPFEIVALLQPLLAEDVVTALKAIEPWPSENDWAFFFEHQSSVKLPARWAEGIPWRTSQLSADSRALFVEAAIAVESGANGFEREFLMDFGKDFPGPVDPRLDRKARKNKIRSCGANAGVAGGLDKLITVGEQLVREGDLVGGLKWLMRAEFFGSQYAAARVAHVCGRLEAFGFLDFKIPDFFQADFDPSFGPRELREDRFLGIIPGKPTALGVVKCGESKMAEGANVAESPALFGRLYDYLRHVGVLTTCVHDIKTVACGRPDMTIYVQYWRIAGFLN